MTHLCRRQWLLGSIAAALSAARAEAQDNCNPSCTCTNTTTTSADLWAASASAFFSDFITLGSAPDTMPEFSGTAFGTRKRLNQACLMPDSGMGLLLVQAYSALRQDSSGKVKASLGSQAYVHVRYCDGTKNIHVSAGGLFVAWHRAFLFFHERLLQHVLIDKCGVDATTARAFRLPYWKPATLDGSIYTNAALSDSTRSPGGCDIPALCPEILTCGQLNDAILDLETWHDAIHLWVCGDMGRINTSGFDPLFYAFHAYVDLLWESSAVKGQLSLSPNPWWAVFYDAFSDQQTGSPEDGWVKVDLTKFANMQDWGYDYDTRIRSQILPGRAPIDVLDFRDLKLPHSSGGGYLLVMKRPHPLGFGHSSRTLASLPVISEPNHHHAYPGIRIEIDKPTLRDFRRGRLKFAVETAGPGGRVSEEVRPDQVHASRRRPSVIL